MAKKQTNSTTRITGTVGVPTLSVSGMMMPWSVEVNVTLAAGAGETVHVFPGVFPMAYVKSPNGAGGFIETPINLTQLTGTGWKGTGQVNTAQKPTGVRVEAKYLSALITKDSV